MKILTVAIPCYNSEAYMRKAIESLLPGGEDIEILIIDDGSQKDNTLKIAKGYEKEYPGIVRAIHQENKGHGGAVNTGIQEASGIYFKVVDSDDWVDSKALLRVIKRLKLLEDRQTPVDMMLTNFVYDKEGVWHKNVMQFRRRNLVRQRINGFRFRVHLSIFPFVCEDSFHHIVARMNILY